ncbi:MAG: hypothetical protein A2275_16485 [Bacteroidetes bacterium RIFOXYA12_FULL_35_11]|nr:MAG: hypothetical protein A2X01_08420 [Bacteroidetes bacterium GWF2_35_48]OFY77182.1 MAG: hypothetical protein A2275_16485 [Bacteroidetes bacterium RIFOXYA12_FULL_35_11]OFY95626.1 MAG: hypothetical protein A2491_17675 [Bacteroidetes bacterium RIFOXYC12_FULL_35_7]
MNTTKKIDYSKFRCEIYSPEGVFIKEASFNQKNDFYCPELVPGQKYFLVFSYDEMFVDCFSFKCETAGKVVYLSTGHLFFNKDYEKIPKELADIIKPKINKAKLYYWNRHKGPRKALDAFIASTHDRQKIAHRHEWPVAYKTGADLSTNV